VPRRRSVVTMSWNAQPGFNNVVVERLSVIEYKAAYVAVVAETGPAGARRPGLIHCSHAGKRRPEREEGRPTKADISAVQPARHIIVNIFHKD